MSAARDNRVLHYAVLVSIILHGLALVSAPQINLVSKRVEEWPLPIAARLVQPAPAPAPAAVEPQPVTRPAAKPAAKPRPAPRPAPAAPVPPEPPVSAAPEPAPAPPTAEAAQAAAPAPRPGAQTDADNIARFRLQVIEQAMRFKRYPRVAQDNNWQGKTGVRVSFGADGRRSSVAVVRSSGYDVLDRQALETVNRADVPVPAGLRGREFAFELDVIFDLKDRPS